MSSTTYQPQAGSTPYSVLAYFKKNPDEELSGADIALKFDIERSNITALLKSCFDHELLARLNRGGSDRLIIAGPKLRTFVLPDAPPLPNTLPNMLATGAAPGQIARRTVNPRPQLPALDITAIAVEPGIEQPAGRNPALKGQTRYDDLFKALHTPGLSAAVPIAYLATLQKAAVTRRKHHGQRFVVRKMSATEARIWRTE